ncbi:hypothetical protein HN587_01165 [Candidatus Woesearchaeota archaeon]|jgi:predicted S18 family serine protease|nr:hypothetical protein [Candidatus Woesearchaeota archaeon]
MMLKKSISKNISILFLLIISLLLLLSQSLFVVAEHQEKQGSLKILAVSTTDSGFKGASATLSLKITPGNGEVFIQTFPLTKIDTQISTRYAKDTACKLSSVDCSKLDFFYTVKSNSAIIGGPSASASFAILTIALLEDLPLDPTVALSGTLNSGQTIGPVGMLKQKIAAANSEGLTTVLIPFGQADFEENIIPKSNQSNENITTNKTTTQINLIEYGKELGITVKEVSYLNDALKEFTGYQFEEIEGDVIINPQYANVMKGVAVDLCGRSKTLKTKFESIKYNVEMTEPNKTAPQIIINSEEKANSLLSKGDFAFENNNFYTAASFCFGSNVQFQNLIHELINKNDEQNKIEIEKINASLDLFEKNLDSTKIKTIADLQAYMIVKERVLESKNLVKESSNNKGYTGYLIERFNSAQSWSSFLGQPGKEFKLDNDALKKSCSDKLNEVDERLQYLNLMFPKPAEELKNNFKDAFSYVEDNKYALCLFKASKTNAEVNMFWSLLGVQESDFEIVLSKKLEAAEKSIVKQINNGIFPILAYSYYEYADSLKDSDNKGAAFIYAEYALELSDIDSYFETTQVFSETKNTPALKLVNPNNRVVIGGATGITGDSIKNPPLQSITTTQFTSCFFVLLIGFFTGYLICLLTKKRVFSPVNSDSWRKTTLKLRK